MFTSIILISISIIICIIGIINMLNHRESYGSQLYMFLNLLLYFFLGIVFFIFFHLSSETYFDKETALTFWNLSILFWIISVLLINNIHSHVIEYKGHSFAPTLIYTSFGCVILGVIFSSESFEIVQTGNNYRFIFQSDTLLIFFIIFNIVIVIQMLFEEIDNYSQLRDKKLARFLFSLAFNTSIIIILYSIYIITHIYLFKFLYSIIYLNGMCIALYINIKKPNVSIDLTNRIHELIIFHKSGILLYSYNFETGKDIEDSVLKGSILIGINHILMNFADKKNQLNTIKMKNRDLILEFDNTHGYAVLLITQKKTKFIEKAVNLFMEKFSEFYQDSLIKLNIFRQLIDISVFNNTKEILNKYFNPYIKKS